MTREGIRVRVGSVKSVRFVSVWVVRAQDAAARLQRIPAEAAVRQAQGEPHRRGRSAQVTSPTGAQMGVHIALIDRSSVYSTVLYMYSTCACCRQDT